jgi:hypothetical protein
MSHSHSIETFLFLSLTSLAAACAHERENTAATTPTSVTTTTSGYAAPYAGEDRVVPNDEAVAQVVQAQCSRVRSCSEPRSFEQDACLHGARVVAASELGTSSCPSGVRQITLDACLHALSIASCTSAGDLLQTGECSASDVCVSRR